MECVRRRSGSWWVVAALLAGAIVAAGGQAAAVGQDESIQLYDAASGLSDGDVVVGELPPHEFVPTIMPATESVFHTPGPAAFSSDGLSHADHGLARCTTADCGGSAGSAKTTGFSTSSSSSETTSPPTRSWRPAAAAT